jgi:Ser/Thr protein kinase RdoA (MazF antagonist)
MIMNEITVEDIEHALGVAGIIGFSGVFNVLGSGEINNSYKLAVGGKQIVMRIAKDKEQLTLKNEASSLRLLDSAHIPKLIYFNEKHKIRDRLWILETYIPGITVERLNIDQFRNLGSLLAEVHQKSGKERHVELWRQFIESCRAFGNEEFLLKHPDSNLSRLINSFHERLGSLQPVFNRIKPKLIHSDATPSNILVNGDSVGLIDWEFSRFTDPMCDFSTIYYEDIEYNKGKWRIKITAKEKEALFAGYQSAGGKIDEDRIKFWIKYDKLGAAAFLYWRINESRRPANESEMKQYKLDYLSLLNSLSSDN